jgi:hypothetical protein
MCARNWIKKKKKNIDFMYGMCTLPEKKRINSFSSKRLQGHFFIDKFIFLFKNTECKNKLQILLNCFLY